VVLIQLDNKKRTTGDGRNPDSRDFKLVIIIAGEASGDLHGSNLVKAMKALDPDTVLWGIGGEKMEQAGVKILFPSSDMAVVGLTEVLYKLQAIARASRELKSILKNNHPDLLILIDYPGFNIYMAKIAKRFGVPVLYYISPQVWAWGRGRVKKISRRVDRMAVILPFEEAFYGEIGMKVDYVGHPLLDAFGPGIGNSGSGNKDLGSCTSRVAVEHPDSHYPVVGLLPGSRKEEIRKLLPPMVKSAEILRQSYPGIRCRLPLAPTIDLEFVQPYIESSSVKITVSKGDIYKVLRGCDIALVASGTATLETAVMGVPMVIVYRASFVSYWVAKMVVKVPYIGLGSLVAGEKVVPELLQGEVTPERLAEEALTILRDDDVRENMIRKLKGIRGSLGRGGASERTAKIAFEMMKRTS
jgi:lipid-A-disaccharide synthase